jgi:hypothetical protein
MKQVAVAIKVAPPRALLKRLQAERNQLRACSTWRVAAVACDLDFVGTNILAQLIAVLIVRPGLTFARRMRALLCFRLRHIPFPFYSARCDSSPTLDARPGNVFGWRVASDSHTPSVVLRATASADTSTNSGYLAFGHAA